MAEKKKMNKPLKIVLLSLASFFGTLFLAVGVVSIYSATYKIPKQKEKIENNTGLVQAYGRSLYDANGDQLVLQGVNFGNIFLQEGWLSPFALEPLKNKDGSYKKDKDNNIQYPEFTEEDFRNGLLSNPNCGPENYDEWFDYYFNSWVSESDYDLLVDLDLNTIRLPIYWRNLLNDDFTRKSEDVAFEYIDKVIEKAKEHNLYIILDLHGVPGSQNGYEHSGDMSQGAAFWHNEEYILAAIDCWEFISEHYATTRSDLSSTIAIFDLMNEPTYRTAGMTEAPCWKIFDRIYDAIRDNGDNHVISMEGCWTFSTLPNPKQFGWENVQYQYHWYNFQNHILPYELFYIYHDMNNMFRDYNVPVLIGEFTFFEDKDEWNRGLDLFDERNYSWTIWNFKGCTVGWWNTSWAVLTAQLQMVTETEERKPNVSTCTFDEFKAVCDKTRSENCHKSTLYEVLSNR